MNAPGPPLVILAGPTAVGKTSLALELCQGLGAEVISADSVQVYRGLDIGSAKPSAAELAVAPHHLIDVADPAEEFDAGRFVDLAEAAMDDIAGRGRRVLVVGGTGLYIKALLYGLAPMPAVDSELRRRLARQWEEQGAEALHARLAELDPEAAGRLHPHDRQRVLRALEVCLQTGRSFSSFQAAHGFGKPRYRFLLLGLWRPRAELFERIERRCRSMWEGGLVEEVRGLLAAGVSRRARSLSSLGYAQVVAMLAGELSEGEALEQMIKKTRAYAKRQLTWFRGMEGINWFEAEDRRGVLAAAREFWEA